MSICRLRVRRFQILVIPPKRMILPKIRREIPVLVRNFVVMVGRLLMLTRIVRDHREIALRLRVLGRHSPCVPMRFRCLIVLFLFRPPSHISCLALVRKLCQRCLVPMFPLRLFVLPRREPRVPRVIVGVVDRLAAGRVPDDVPTAAPLTGPAQRPFPARCPSFPAPRLVRSR